MVFDTCISKNQWNGESLTRKSWNHAESKISPAEFFSVRWQKNGHDYKYMNFGRQRIALKCPLYSDSAALTKMIKKKGLEDYMDRVEALAYSSTSKSYLSITTYSGSEQCNALANQDAGSLHKCKTKMSQ